jgi:hypothetical protein
MSFRFKRSWVAAGLVVVACQSHHTRPIGGDWAIDYVTSTAPEPGQTRGDLVAVHGNDKEVVDQYVWSTRYFAPDCIGYHKSHTSNDELLFVCGSHQPVLLARESNPDAWTFDDGGARKVALRDVRAGRPVEIGVRFSIDALRRSATQTPQRSAQYVAVDLGRKLVPDSFVYDASKDVDRRDYNGRTPLMNAIANYETAQVAALIQAGADVNARDTTGDTALHLAQDAETAKMLIAAGADVNARAEDGGTPLTVAVKDHKVEIARVLLDAHADYRIAERLHWTDGDHEFTPLAYAIDNNDETIAQMLRDAGATK